MKRTVIVVMAILLLSCTAWASDKSAPRLITVSGDAEIRVVPDEVVFTIGVETSGRDIEAAKNLNDERIKRLLALTKEYKIDPKLVQTDYMSIQPFYNKEGKLDSYYVRKSMVIIMKDISRFEHIISDFVKAGGNYVPGIQFRTTELRKHRDAARSLAIKAAKDKAIKLANELGQKVGRPYTISEGSSQWASSYGSRSMRNVSQNVSLASSGDTSGEGTIAPGSISVTATVTVSFELE